MPKDILYLTLIILVAFSIVQSSKGFNIDNNDENSNHSENETNLAQSMAPPAGTDDVLDKMGIPKLQWKVLNTYGDNMAFRGSSQIYHMNKLIKFGGCNPTTYECSNQIFTYDIRMKNLFEITTKGTRPTPRQGNCIVKYGNEMQVIGGSNDTGYLNDMYSQDLEHYVWEKIIPSNAPLFIGRTNHGCVIDHLQRVIVFGGETKSGLTNEIFYYKMFENEWKKPIPSGERPTPRDNFAMNIYNSQIYVFGGYQQGKSLNEMYIFDLSDLQWTKLDAGKMVPSPRVGVTGHIFGSKIMYVGGCDFDNQCYNEVWQYNIITLDYTILYKSMFNIHNADVFNLGFGPTATSGEVIFFYGGCGLSNTCQANFAAFNTTENCPDDCGKHGICKASGCLCNNDWTGNSCQEEVKCQEECNENSYCTRQAVCQCYPGWTGTTCYAKINCPQNCTSEYHGVCNNDATCTCNAGFSGTNCAQSGDSNDEDVTNKGQVQGGAMQKVGAQTNGGASTTLNPSKELDYMNTNLQMFGYNSYEYLLMENGNDFFAKYDSIDSCPSSCHMRGFCMKKICYCKPGYIGTDCGYDHYNYKKNDEYTKDAKMNLIIYGSVSGGIGLFLGILFSCGAFRKNKDVS